MRPIPEPTPRGARLGLLLLVLAILLATGLLVYRPWSGVELQAPPGLAVAEARRLSDNELVGRTTRDLLFHLVSPREDPQAWKTLSDPARQVFMLAYADDQLRRERILDLSRRIRLLGSGLTLSQVGEAYAAIGLTRVAELLQRADEIAKREDPALSDHSDTSDGVAVPQVPDPFAAIQPDLRRALASASITKPCADYIRAHADQILAH